MQEPWRIRLLGGLQVCQGDRILTRFRTQRTGALLAYLAFYGDRSHPREVLVSLLWPESEPELGRHSLSQALSSLRHQLEPPGVPAGSVLRADRFSVGLDPRSFTTDVAEFRCLVRQAVQAASSVEQVGLLAQAVGMCQPPLLPGYYEEWLDAERARIATEYLAAASKLATLLEERGELTRAVVVIRRAVAAEPLREETHRHLIRLLAATGDPAAALRHYRDLERLLARELGVRPDEQTRALVAALKRDARAAGPGDPQARRAPAERQGSPRAALPGHPEEGAAAASASAWLPAARGTVTFLVAGLAPAPAQAPEGEGPPAAAAPPAAEPEERALLAEAFRRHRGQAVAEQAGAIPAAFASAADALACVLDLCRLPAATAPPRPRGLAALRLAIHAGEAGLGPEGWQGRTLGRALQVLHAAHPGQILCSEAAAGLLRRDLPPDIHLDDLGLYHMPGEETPERLFSVQVAGRTPCRFPPPNAAPVLSGQLPIRFTRFFGRDEELADLCGLLAPVEGETQRRLRLVTITGPGGCGKTRLAIEAAGRLIEAHRGAVWFVSLEDVAAPAQIPDALLEGLSLTHSPLVEPLEHAGRLLARQPSLLVLDNVEHLVEEVAALVQFLLTRAPALTILATSRRPLNLEGERRFPLSPLPTPQGPLRPEQLSRCASVQLFTDRAQAVLPDFHLTDGNAAAVAELCDRLEGIPLAIELAAARAQVFTPAHMLAQLERRFDFLVSGRRGTAERQRTLRAAMDWSYRLLAPELQRFFTRLSIFRGGWSVEAAEAICIAPGDDGALSPGMALDYLAQLAECSLVVVHTNTRCGGLRFRMLETVREYAWECLDPAEREALTRRHAEYLCHFVEQAARHLEGCEQAVWFARLEQAYDNVQLAQQWWRTHGTAETALRWGVALGRFWVSRGDAHAGREWLAWALARENAPGPPLLRAQALWHAGRLARAQGDYPAARSLHQQALAISRQAGGSALEAQALASLAEVAIAEGNYECASVLAAEALQVSRRGNHRLAEANALLNLGNVASETGDHPRARACYEEALAICRETGARLYEAEVLRSLAVTLKEWGHWEQVGPLLDQALALYRELGHRRGEGGVLITLADLAYYHGDLAQARRHYEQALRIHRQVGNPAWEAVVLSSLGLLALDEGRLAEARSLAEQALAIARTIQGRAVEAVALMTLGKVLLGQSDLGAAARRLAEALRLQRALGTRRDSAETLDLCVQVCLAAGRVAEAVQLCGSLEALLQSLGVPAQSYLSEHKAAAAQAREHLGPAAYEAAWAKGRSLTWEQILDYAIVMLDG